MAATIVLLLAPVVFVSLTVLAAYVAGDDFTLRAALIAAVVAGGCASFVPRLSQTARSALRRARFNPWGGGDVPMPPSDAPHLNYRINAHEPDAFPQSSSEEDRVQRIVRALTAARIDARVAGVDTGAHSRSLTDPDRRES